MGQKGTLNQIGTNQSMQTREISGGQDKKLDDNNYLKTRSIVARCQYMILDGIKPESMLVFTFTKKAANELKERISSAIGNMAKLMTVSTYHSFCCTLLRRYATYCGRNHNFSVYDEEDKKSVLAPICKAASGYKYSMACDYISKFKEKNITAAKAETMKFDNSFSRMAAKIYIAYEKEMRKRNAFDFDDLTLHAFSVLRNVPEALKFVTDKYQYVMADEFQDSNKQNVDFALLLASKSNNICFVMDSDQSIYGFRGADVKNIVDTINCDDFKKYYLNRNYRSTQTIVKASKSLIAKNSLHLNKALVSNNEIGEKINVFNCMNGEQEARFIAYKIKELHNINLVAYKDIAILCRLQYLSREIEESLLENEIPYVLKNIKPFYCRREIKDLVCYARILYNPNDIEAFSRIINIPKRGIGATVLGKILKNTSQNNTTCDIIEASKSIKLGPKSRASLDNFLSLYDTMKEKAATCDNVAELISFIVDRLKFKEFVSENYADSVDPVERLANIDELIRLCYRYQTLDEFLNNSIVGAEDINTDDESPNGVNILTMHGAKGLEYQNVFIYSAADTTIPYIKSHDSLTAIEEERRLFYVAMTRAKKRLYITYPSIFKDKTRQVYAVQPSRFISEIPGDLKNFKKQRYIG